MLIVLGLASPLAAQTYPNAYIGPDMSHKAAQPEHLQVFDPRIRMAARIVFKGGDRLADRVTGPAVLRVEMGFITSKDVPHDTVRLRCRYLFVAPDNTSSEVMDQRLCWQGNLGDVAGQWVPMDKARFDFRPDPTDPNGTHAVHVEVTDEISGRVKVFLPSYDWQGGQR